jgi:outer membrane protein assembly complex protein YaeT
LALGVLAAPPAGGVDELLDELLSVAVVRVEGAPEVGRRDLTAVLKTRAGGRWPWSERRSLRLDFLRADTAALAAVCRHYGFLDARASWTVEPLRRADRVRVVFRIVEGPRSRIASVSLEGVSVYPQTKLKRQLLARPGRPFDPAILQLDTLNISSAYQEEGYRPHTRARYVRDSTAVHVTYEIIEGSRYRFGESYVAGLETVKERFVRRELVLPPGENFRISRVRQSIERLYESGLFDRVQISPLPDSTNSEILFYVLVHERKRHWIDGGIGAGTAERFRASGEWGNRNLSYTGLQGALSAVAALDANGDFRLGRGAATVLSPWNFGIRLPLRTTAYAERRDDRSSPYWVQRSTAYGITFQLSRSLNRFTRLTLSQDNAVVDQDLDYTPGFAPNSGISDSLDQFFVAHYRTNRLGLTLDRDFRDDPINTNEGSRQVFTAEVAGGPVLGGSSFWKYTGVSSWYTRIGQSWVLAARLGGGFIRPFGERYFSPPEQVDDQVRRVPLEDRFRLGGVNTVRGYEEGAIGPNGGLAMVLGNLELRVPLAGPLGVELFLDGGNVWARPEYLVLSVLPPTVSEDHVDANEMRYTAGAGLRFMLPVGPLRVDWAWAFRNPEAYPGSGLEDPGPIIGRWQFAIGPSF